MVAVMLAAVTTGCFHASVTTGLRPSGETVEDKWTDSFISGLVPPNTVAAGSICGEGRIACVDTRVSFLNQFVSFLTLGIYSPMEIVVTCAVPAQGGIRSQEVPMADEPERQGIRSALTASLVHDKFCGRDSRCAQPSRAARDANGLPRNGHHLFPVSRHSVDKV